MRLAGGAAGGDLLSVAGDEQQRVVDREPEAEPGGDVEREDRGVDEGRHDPQHEERADDRDAANQQRDRGGDDAAEDDQQQQRQQREGDQLGLGQVGFGLVVDFVEARRVAAHRDVERAAVDRRLDVFGGEAAGALAVGGGEEAEDDEGTTVTGDQLGVGGGVQERVEDPADVARLGDFGAEPPDLAPQDGTGGVEPPAAGGADDEDDAGVGVIAEGFGQLVASPARSGRRGR